MDQVVIIFHDGELLYARIPTLQFDLPVIEARVENVDSNSEEAVLPLVGIRQIIVGPSAPAPPRATLEGWDKAAFHFIDGQVTRAWIDPASRLGAHGGVWTLVEPDSDEMRTIGMPYAALKGIYRVRRWDSRSPAERTSGRGSHLENLVRALAEREARARRDGLENGDAAATSAPPARPSTHTVNVVGRAR